jgi:hypothetical protein
MQENETQQLLAFAPKKRLAKTANKDQHTWHTSLGGSLEDRFGTERETEMAPVMLGSEGGRNTRGRITKEALGDPIRASCRCRV